MITVSVKGLFVALTVAIFSFSFFPLLMVWPALFVFMARILAGRRPAVLVHIFNLWYNSVQQLWVELMVMLIECLLQLRLAYTLVSGPGVASLHLTNVFAPPRRGKFKIIILNHRCRIDWIMLFPFLARAGALRSLRIVLKDGLSRIPIFGWSMQLFCYIFLSRKWANDEARMRAMIAHYHENGGATILLFPEGTDLSPSSIVRSNMYAVANNLPCFHHVLNPRSTGLLAMKNIIGASNIEEIIDVTMGYTDVIPGERPSEVSFINGRMPKKVHILCTRHRLSLQEKEEEKGAMQQRQQANDDDTVPANDNGLRDWLNDRFSKKELLLSQFYSSNPVGFEAHHIRSVFGENCTIVTHDEDDSVSQHSGSMKLLHFVRDMGFWYGIVRVILFWSVPVIFWMLYCNWWLLLWSGLVFCVCIWATHIKGGLEQWLILHHPQQEPKAMKED